MGKIPLNWKTKMAEVPSPQMTEQLDNEEVREILKNTTDLRQYSRQIEKEFKEVENKSIEGKHHVPYAN